MKKLLAILLVMALGLIGAAFAEETEGRTINCDIEDGAYVIRLTLNEGEDGWKADDMAQDDSIVKLDSAAIEDGCFVARYSATGDGEVSVGLRHFDGIACDAVYTWDLTVKDGAVIESTGGSATESPDEAEQDSAVSGDWIQAEGSGEMTIAKNEGKGWNVTLLTPGEGGAVQFTANIFYDCELDELVYDDGRFVKVPVTDGEEAAEGEEIESGASGNFTFAGESEDDVRLVWYNSLSPEETIEFVRPAGGRIVEPMPAEIDFDNGSYAAAFDRANVNDGEIIGARFFTVDCYDIVDIDTLRAGDTIVIDGNMVTIETLERDDYGDLVINGGMEAEGYVLRAYDEDNCWKIVGEDDFNTYSEKAEADLILDQNVTFTDGWDIEKEPETFTGVEAVTKAIAESENEYFSQYNTTLRLENGRVVEIVRVYNP